MADQEKINRELWNICLAMTNDASLDPFPYLKKGIRVEVRSGPFAGIQGGDRGPGEERTADPSGGDIGPGDQP